MPIFEYLCQDCGTKFEKLIRRAEDSDGLTCPSCGQKHLRTQLSTFAAHAGGTRQESKLPPCAQSGMCPTPGLCGRN
jgi:putative FmdB family regulatory protein